MFFWRFLKIDFIFFGKLIILGKFIKDSFISLGFLGFN